jgi:hypothetical protein
MSIDERGQRAGALLRTTHEQVDVDDRLDDLFVAVRRRRRATTTAAVVAAAALAVGVGVVAGDVTTRADAPATTAPDPSDADRAVPQCDLVFISCEPDRQFTVRMSSTMRWQLPNQFDRDLHPVSAPDGARAIYVESYRRGDLTAGVSVVDSAVPARMSDDGSSRVVRDGQAPTDAHGLAAWLAGRPYLTASAVHRSTVGGREAWAVEVRMRHPRVDGPTSCANQARCWPTLLIGGSDIGSFIGSWDSMISDFTFVDIPGGRTTAVWSWTFGQPRTLQANQALVDSIRFRTD